MLSRGSSRKHDSKRSNSQWSEWEWNGEYQRYQRWRLTESYTYEYDYAQAQPALEISTDTYRDQTGTSSQDTQTLPNISEDDGRKNSVRGTESHSKEEDKSQWGYSVQNELEDVTESFSRTALTSDSNSYQPYSIQHEYSNSETSQPSTYQAPQTNAPRRIYTRDPSTRFEKTDPRFKVHRSRDFEFGRVFKILRQEPITGYMQSSAGGASSSSSSTEENGFDLIRLLVIVKCMKGECICLPIVMYRRPKVKGTEFFKGEAGAHAVIYTTKEPPPISRQEASVLTKIPIRVIPLTPQYKLDTSARLNYAQTYVVEHDAKVLFIGNVHKRSAWQLQADFDRHYAPTLSGREVYEPSTQAPGDPSSQGEGNMGEAYRPKNGASYIQLQAENGQNYRAYGNAYDE